MAKVHSWQETDDTGKTLTHTLNDYADEHTGHTLTLEKIYDDPNSQYRSVQKAFCATCKRDVILNLYEVTVE